MKTVKIGDAEYRKIKALAAKRGRYLQFEINKAIRDYLAKAQSEMDGQVFAAGRTQPRG